MISCARVGTMCTRCSILTLNQTFPALRMFLKHELYIKDGYTIVIVSEVTFFETLTSSLSSCQLFLKLAATWEGWITNEGTRHSVTTSTHHFIDIDVLALIKNIMHLNFPSEMINSSESFHWGHRPSELQVLSSRLTILLTSFWNQSSRPLLAIRNEAGLIDFCTGLYFRQS